MARNYLHDAIESCRYCMGCSAAEHTEHKRAALDLLKFLDRQEIQRKPRPNWTKLEQYRRACNKCVYHCRRETPGIADVFNRSA